VGRFSFESLDEWSPRLTASIGRGYTDGAIMDTAPAIPDVGIGELDRPSGTRRWREFLLEKVDGSSLALFRILFGLLMLIEVLRYFANGWISQYYIQPHYLFGFVPGIHPWPGNGMYWHFGVLGICAVLIAVGLWFRWAAWVFCLGFTYVFLLDKAQYLNHFYLICLMSGLLALSPAAQTGSLDARRKPPASPWIPRWPLLLLQLFVALVFFFGGIAKLNGDWLRGEPQRMWLIANSSSSGFRAILAEEWVVQLVTWGGLFVDLGLGILLLIPKTFWIGVVVAFVFNVSNAFLFSIGIFPPLMLATLALFGRPQWPRRWFENEDGSGFWTGTRLQTVGSSFRVEANPGGTQHWAILFFHAFLIVQLALPLRHFLLPGSVHWTEEGHRFSWHMKLRDKIAQVSMAMIHPVTGERAEIRLSDWLTARQIAKMGARPDMILQFAHHLADTEEKRTGLRPVIRVNVVASLNGRPFQYFINPETDLAAERRGLGHRKWILPLIASD
jgi:hypothetical protein